MSLLVLSAHDVDQVVATMSPADLQLSMARVFSRFSSSKGGDTTNNGISMPPRLTISTPNYTSLFMPARIGPPDDTSLGGTTSADDTTIKVVSVPNRSGPKGLPATTLVLDENTGAVKAVVNARKLTALRNAAGSLLSVGLVTDFTPIYVVAFGAGKQIEAHLNLLMREYTSIASCTIVNRSFNDRTLSLQASLKASFPHRFQQNDIAFCVSESTDPYGRVGQAVRYADIIICATPSTKPLFPSSWVKTGAHIILIGSYKPEMREVDKDLILRSLDGGLVVDSRDACLHEAGELIDAQVRPEQMKEIGELVPMKSNGDVDLEAYELSRIKSRFWNESNKCDGPVTIFKSVGLGLQDVAIASAVVEKALSAEDDSKVGTMILGYDM